MKHEFERPRRTAVMLDPHPLCHTALAEVLAPYNIDLVGATTSTCAARTLIQRHRPDLLVVEVDLPDARDEALDLIEDARGDAPDVTVVVLSATDDHLLVDTAFDRGASAYVLKTSDPHAIVAAIMQAFEPSLYLSRPRNGTTTSMGPVGGALARKLTRREVEILQLVSGGRSNREVAEILWVTDQTVKFHLANVYRKLGVRSRFEAAQWAREQGLVEALPATTNVVSLSSKANRSDGRSVLLPLHQPLSTPTLATEAGETSR
jgi:DNA-binding NarL/FixJ family response regulator